MATFGGATPRAASCLTSLTCPDRPALPSGRSDLHRPLILPTGYFFSIFTMFEFVMTKPYCVPSVEARKKILSLG